MLLREGTLTMDKFMNGHDAKGVSWEQAGLFKQTVAKFLHEVDYFTPALTFSFTQA